MNSNVKISPTIGGFVFCYVRCHFILLLYLCFCSRLQARFFYLYLARFGFYAYYFHYLSDHFNNFMGYMLYNSFV